MSITHHNPVWPRPFADPFVLRWRGEYYAYGTGPLRDGRAFPMLHSTDFVHWAPLANALTVKAAHQSCHFWAPEVAERDGRFYLYYSRAAAGDESHRLSVAIADNPAGPFDEVGPLAGVDDGFAIDAHPFHDPRNGNWYLFFAKDFFDNRAGTALAAARLSDDMLSLVGSPAAMLRASADWQIYERERTLYGKRWDAWHTCEGPCVVFHDNRYYLLYSGGNWRSDGYGVGCAVAESALGPYVEPEAGAVVLHGVGDNVIGPGHNSVVVGPDNVTQYIVYHAWDKAHTARRMCVDKLVWTADGPRCSPTWGGMG